MDRDGPHRYEKGQGLALMVKQSFERDPHDGDLFVVLRTGNHDLAKEINLMLRRWTAFTRFLDDGRISITTTPPNARCITLGRKS